jgi:hypothetical protein
MALVRVENSSCAIINAITVIALARSWILLPQPQTFLFTLWCQSCWLSQIVKRRPVSASAWLVRSHGVPLGTCFLYAGALR